MRLTVLTCSTHTSPSISKYSACVCLIILKNEGRSLVFAHHFSKIILASTSLVFPPEAKIVEIGQKRKQARPFKVKTSFIDTIA